MNESICFVAASYNISNCITRSENVSENDECDTTSSGMLLTMTWFRILIYFFYMSIFFIALLGNSLVCYVFYANIRMRTLTNYFIVNLAVSDILIALFCVPTSFISTLILMYWPFGLEVCVIVNFLQVRNFFISYFWTATLSSFWILQKKFLASLSVTLRGGSKKSNSRLLSCFWSLDSFQSKIYFVL